MALLGQNLGFTALDRIGAPLVAGLEIFIGDFDFWGVPGYRTWVVDRAW